jgi:Calmodulin-binding
MPPGTRLMTENERIKTLEELQHQKTDVSDLLFSLPLSLRTDALKAKKRELEAKLVEIERAITTFSRKVVYIKDDGHEVDPKSGIFPVEVAYQKPPTPLKKSTKATALLAGKK